MAEIRIGCSGWQYRHWGGVFYPRQLRQGDWFQHYASVFDTVEINNTFYNLPEVSTFRQWRRRAPQGFLYAIKASRYLTHMKKLKDPREPLENLLGRARELGHHLGPILYQLPPRWARNPQRLGDFLAALPNRWRHVVEFRDPSWYHEESYDLLRRHGVALCLHDMPGSESPRLATAPFVYARYHGARGGYEGDYPHQRLAAWADWLGGQAGQGLDVYAYFNNDIGGFAPVNARQLREYLLRRV